MNEDRLRQLLRDVEPPGAAEAERRGRGVVERAYAERLPIDRPVLPRLAVALAAATLLASLVLSPAGAAVRDWIGDALTDGVPNAEPALTDLPGGGRLLVQSPAGPWVVQPDGAQRLLGDYRTASWSPRGLFVAVAEGGRLSAVEPDGTPRWSISPGRTVADPRWSPSGFRIAYRAGEELRVVDADGTGDRLLDAEVAATAPVWLTLGAHLLAYVDADGRLRVVEADRSLTVASTAAERDTVAIASSGHGGRLLEWGRTDLRLREIAASKLAGGVELGPPLPVRLPRDAAVVAAAFAPRGTAIAVLLRSRGPVGRGPRSEVLLVTPPGDGASRRLFSVSGRLTGLTWSPDGTRLLVAWPEADQWLFLPTDGPRRIEAVEGVGAVFSPGSSGPAPFPRVAGWCCAGGG